MIYITNDKHGPRCLPKLTVDANFRRDWFRSYRVSCEEWDRLGQRPMRCHARVALVIRTANRCVDSFAEPVLCLPNANDLV